jgi:predicted Rossmann fold nucleotide-binding protein DprA/Smf involved in DNA uptake
MGVGGKWVDRDSDPVVRPYAVTGGRTEPADGEVLDLIAVVAASGRLAEPADLLGLSPEHRRILNLCRRPATVADVASDMGLPIGVVRVLLADLVQQGRIKVLPGRPAGQKPSAQLLREVLHGLRAL